MKGILKFSGDEIKLKTSADCVKYSDTTVASFLENYSPGKILHAEKVDSAEKTFKDSDGKVLTDTYLTISNAEMTGTPTAPTYEGTDTSVNQIATCGYFNSLVRKTAGEVDSDMTLAKLITSINKNPNFATSTAEQLDEKQNSDSTLTKISEINFSADKILYSADSETFLTTPISNLGKKIFAAADVEKIRWLIRAETAQEFFDETENIHWVKVGSPAVNSTNAKFGGKALQVSSGNYIYSKESVYLGGKNFTIQFFANCYSLPKQWSSLIKITNSGNNGLINFYKATQNSLNHRILTEVYNSAGSKIVSDSIFDYSGQYLDKVTHYEICYNGSTLYVFVNGVLQKTFSANIERLARQIYLGNTAAGSIDEFRILDGVCAHTENFSLPNAEYDLTDETVSLLHF